MLTENRIENKQRRSNVKMKWAIGANVLSAVCVVWCLAAGAAPEPKMDWMGLN